MSKKIKTGIVGIYSDPEKLMEAARKIREMKVKNMDAFTPFPVHGMEEAIGIPRSKLPWVTLLAGLTGATAAFGLQIWVSAVNFPLNVGGKPLISLPAFVPVGFELTVLFAGLATAGALFLFTGMPNFNPQIFHPEITNNKFALFISSTDRNYRETEFMDIMKGTGCEEVRVIK